MNVKIAKTTVDLTGAELYQLIRDKVSEGIGREVTERVQVDITYAYDKRADGKGYKKSDRIKRVRVTL